MLVKYQFIITIIIYIKNHFCPLPLLKLSLYYYHHPLLGLAMLFSALYILPHLILCLFFYIYILFEEKNNNVLLRI
uniref:Uncharacterized protein n=1 Tax=Lepeophtheirus salmonis TaxID=72036 RepID=A0A0K2U8Y7_LEPSM